MNVDLFSRIEVTPPYFAFETLASEGDQVVAPIAPEQNRGGEESLMASAEVGRHLAILGSCALAQMQAETGRFFYLAQEATLVRLPASESAVRGPLQARARARHLTARDASATAELCNGQGQALFQLDVDYKVLRPAVFQKLYRAHHCPTPPSTRNPYLDNAPLRVSALDANGMEAYFGPVEPADCAGHFDDYPCLPVAILMHTLSQAAGYYFALGLGLTAQDALSIGRAFYQVQKAHIRAHRLVFAGQAVRINVRPPRSYPSEDIPSDWAEMEVFASDPDTDEVFGSALMTLSPAPNAVLRKKPRSRRTFVPSVVYFNSTSVDGDALWAEQPLPAEALQDKDTADAPA
ncbi:hypothetical protein [Amphibiibacter pelophylacis]|uniref:Uncharacterized protein n=1 Tax=Amphibiibacter pelophylacis TaxID=1799477 RepID=A0ACC6P2D8_9BURK